MAPRALAAGAVLTLCIGCGASGTPPSSSSVKTAGAPAALVRESRPIGRGARFHPPARGPVIGACRPSLGARRGVHVEVFAANRVVLLAAGIGTRPPRRRFAGRITGAGCFGSLVTLEPTGVVLLRPGQPPTLAALFRSWGQPLSRRRVAGFGAGPGRGVAVFVDGHHVLGAPGAVRLRTHAEIVLEVGPHVTPHSTYTFPPGS